MLKIPGRIETDRLVIRPHIPADLDSFVEFMTDDQATQYMPFDAEQRTPEGARELLEYVIQSYDSSEPVFALAILDKETEAFLGSCGLSELRDEENGLECFFSLLPRYWGWGFATESLAALTYYSFEELGAVRVTVNVSEDNPKSWRVALNVGMKDEGPHHYKYLPRARLFSIDKSAYFGDEIGQ